MKTIALSMLLGSGVVFAGVAQAQDAPPTYMPPTPYTFSEQQRHDPPLSGAWMDSWHGDPDLVFGSDNPYGAGIAALQANDFAKAEQIFNRSLLFNKNDVTARFYMGVTKVKLEKWEEAKRYLKTPARDLRKVPDPKGYLGVTYAKLGDTKAALAQRASLLKMAEACQGTCEHSSYIANGIQMIDEALVLAPSGEGMK
jgi:tetratricopeptide (TPR) repeat protein